MNTRKLCLRLAVFLCTLTIAVIVTRPFLPRPHTELPLAPPAPPPAVDTAAKVNFKVLQVVSDFTHRKTYVQLEVERDPHAPAPEFLSVSLALSIGEGCGVQDVHRPFAQGDRATHTAVFSCPYQGSEPVDNMYARVAAWTETEVNNDFMYHQFHGFKDADTLIDIPVVVEHKQKH
jgi:hypothetical protein